jgi:hypothetical protein
MSTAPSDLASLILRPIFVDDDAGEALVGVECPDRFRWYPSIDVLDDVDAAPRGAHIDVMLDACRARWEEHELILWA